MQNNKIKWINCDIQNIVRFVLLLAFGVIFGNVIHEVVLLVDKSDDITVFPLGTFMVLVFIFGFVLYIGSIADVTRFNLLISQGCTRHEYFYGRVIENVVEIVLGIGIAYGCNRYEMWKFKTFYKDIPVELDISDLFKFKFIVPALLLVSAIAFTASVCIMKFGVKAQWSLWFIFMFICAGVPRLMEEVTKHMNTEKILANLELFQYTIIGIVVIISIGLLVIDRLVILKQEVRI